RPSANHLNSYLLVLWKHIPVRFYPLNNTKIQPLQCSFQQNFVIFFHHVGFQTMYYFFTFCNFFVLTIHYNHNTKYCFSNKLLGCFYFKKERTIFSLVISLKPKSSILNTKRLFMEKSTAYCRSNSFPNFLPFFIQNCFLIQLFLILCERIQFQITFLMEENMSKLLFYFSTMAAGKSMEIIKVAYNYEIQGKKVVALTSHLDNRFEVGRIWSRAGFEKEAFIYKNDTNIRDLILNL